ncbi:hypothetical protein TNCT1_69990 [Streptomyces sp. 1-11]|nr:hypothetical protein TNCT1_69990 [Streptomyces sp. 1-11]
MLLLVALHAWAYVPDQRYVLVMAERHAYPSDLSDARWELIEPLLSAWRAERRRHALNIGRPPEHDLREIMNAIPYVDRTGVQGHYLPHEEHRHRHPRTAPGRARHGRERAGLRRRHPPDRPGRRGRVCVKRPMRVASGST